MNKSDVKHYSEGLVQSMMKGKMTLEEAVIQSSAATGCTKDFARKILSECLAENGNKKVVKSSRKPIKSELNDRQRRQIDWDKLEFEVNYMSEQGYDDEEIAYRIFEDNSIEELDEFGFDGDSFTVRQEIEDAIRELKANNVNSSRKPVKSGCHGKSKKGKKSIKSGRCIKSGTSNFGSNDDIFGYSFPLVTYIAENYVYDMETDTETEERDYDADDDEYRNAIDEAKDLADKMNIPQYDDYSEPYLCHEPFMIKFRDGYYEGVWIEVKEGTDEEDIYNTNEYGSYYDGGRPFTDEEMNKFADKLNEYFNKLCSDYGWQKLGVTARFSNGETWYNKIDNSRKPVKSAKKPIKSMRYNTLSELNNVINILWDINDVARSTCGEEGYQAIKTAITAVQDAWNICKQGMEKKGMDTSVYSSRKPIKSGMTYEQVLDMFTSEGKPWDDYWSMQQDWTAFVDSLERDGEVDYEEARWWDNPCTPKTFDEWVGRSNDDEYDEYYDDGEWDE